MSQNNQIYPEVPPQEPQPQPQVTVQVMPVAAANQAPAQAAQADDEKLVAAKAEVKKHQNKVHCKATVLKVLGVLGIFGSAYLNFTAMNHSQHIIMNIKHPELAPWNQPEGRPDEQGPEQGPDHHGPPGHHGGFFGGPPPPPPELEEEMSAPLTRDEFRLYDTIKVFSMLTFLASMALFATGKTGLHAARVNRKMAAKHGLRRSLIFTAVFCVFAFLAVKEGKKMKRILRGVEDKMEQEATNKTIDANETMNANETQPVSGRQLWGRPFGGPGFPQGPPPQGDFMRFDFDHDDMPMNVPHMHTFSFDMMPPMRDTNETETETAPEWDAERESYRMFASRVYDDMYGEEDHHRGDRHHKRGERPEHHEDEQEQDGRKGPCHGRKHCRIMKIVGFLFFLFKMCHFHNMYNLFKAHENVQAIKNNKPVPAAKPYPFQQYFDYGSASLQDAQNVTKQYFQYAYRTVYPPVQAPAPQQQAPQQFVPAPVPQPPVNIQAPTQSFDYSISEPLVEDNTGSNSIAPVVNNTVQADNESIPYKADIRKSNTNSMN